MVIPIDNKVIPAKAPPTAEVVAIRRSVHA
jgi:hypothetical protein